MWAMADPRGSRLVCRGVPGRIRGLARESIALAIKGPIWKGFTLRGLSLRSAALAFSLVSAGSLTVIGNVAGAQLPLANAQAPAQGVTPPQDANVDYWLFDGQVVDGQGRPVAGASVRDAAGTLLGTTNDAGIATMSCSPGSTVVVEARGFAPQKIVCRGHSLVTLAPSGDQQSVSVTAYRAPLGELESPASTRRLTTANLQESAAITLDGQLRLIPGVETFRRSSSLVANPSSQGLSLRGLGSTSASRTLLTEDDVPLNDAFAGWIRWEELPELSIRSIEAVRGGASDLYGSSAIGGVINIIPERPGERFAELKSDYGSENTYQDSLLLEGRQGHWGGLATGGVLGTDGFTQLAPAARGLVDVNSNVHAQNGLVLIDRTQGSLRLFAKTSALNEARGNGTPLQLNGTRLWRYSTGADWDGTNSPLGWAKGSSLLFRLYGSAAHFRQTFSTIAANRNSEVLNRFAKTPDNELGAVLHWSKPLTPGLLLLVGADTHDTRAGDFESVIKAGVLSYVNLSDRQRQTGLYGELLWIHDGWTLSASAREDWFNNFDGQRWLPAVAPLAQISEHVFDPRLGVSRKLGSHFALSGSGFRAYRAPSPNELYRSTQVGSLLTLPNNDLHSERATGWETGLAMEQRWGTLRGSYFWTQVNRPITAVTTNPHSNPIQLTRENLGQIESRGVSIDAQFKPTRWMTLTTGYQHTNATVTKAVPASDEFPQQSVVAGDWIPQVAHNMATAQLRGYTPKLGTISLQSKISGHQFDDDANTYMLHGYFKLDAYASHDFGKRIELFSSGENLFNRNI
jgi:outer membrane cobalamin receptor